MAVSIRYTRKPKIKNQSQESAKGSRCLCPLLFDFPIPNILSAVYF